MMLINYYYRKGVRKGKEFKTLYYTSAAAIHDYIIIYNIIPNSITLINIIYIFLNISGKSIQ